MDTLRNVEYLRALVAATDAGSLSAAARKLGVTQPVLSRKLAKLETRLGIRLALRSPQAFVLTDEGRRLYDMGRDILSQLDSTFESLEQSEDTLVGRLRLTAPEAFGALHIAPFVAELQLQHPRLSVELLIVDRVVDLVAEGVDLAIRVGRVEDTNLMTMRVTDFDYVLVSSPDYLARHPPIETIEQLRAHDVVAYGTNTGQMPLSLSDGKDKHLVQVSSRLASNNVHAVRAALLKGAGVGMAARWFVGRALAEGKLIEVLPDYDPPTNSFSIAHPFLSFVPMRVRIARDFIAERIRKVEGLRRGSSAYNDSISAS